MCVGRITGTTRHCASFVFAALHIPPPLASQHGDLIGLINPPGVVYQQNDERQILSLYYRTERKTVLPAGSDADVIQPETVRRTEPEVQRWVKVRQAQV